MLWNIQIFQQCSNQRVLLHCFLKIKKIAYGILQRNPPIPPIKENIPNSLRKTYSFAPNEAPRIGIINVKVDIRVVFTNEEWKILKIIKDAIIGLNKRTKNSDRVKSESRDINDFNITKNIPVNDPLKIPKVKKRIILFNFFLTEILIG